MQTSGQSILFSIIVPVYNVEPYLEECLESIAEQGEIFNRTELIVVNDGSTDESLAVAQEVAQRYPQRIQVIDRENQGVSATKNYGMSIARGKYIGFLDSDDKYGPDTLSAAAERFAELGDEVDVLAFPMHLFEKMRGPHRLNRKFNLGDRVLQVTDEWADVQLSAASCFFKRSCLEELQLQFNPALALAEDATFVTEAIMRLGRLGLCTKAKYLYRRRTAGGSAIDTFATNTRSYTTVLRDGWIPLLNKYQDANGLVPRYVQNVVAHDMEWRLKQKQQTALSAAEYEEYRALLVQVIKRIDDDVWLAQPFLGQVHMIYALNLKHDEQLTEVGRWDDDRFIYRGRELWRATRYTFRVNIDLIDYREGTLHLHARYFGVPTSECEFGVFVDDEFIPATIEATPDHSLVKNNGTEVFAPVIASLDVPLKPGQRLCFGLRIGENVIDEVPVNYLNTARMPNFPRAYRRFGKTLVLNRNNRALYVESATPAHIAKRELLHTRRMAWAMFKGKSVEKTIPLYRLAAIVGKKLLRKELWIISDRPFAAGDNGEAFFRYVVDHCPENVVPVFSIRKSAPAYKELRKLGRVIDQDSKLGKLIFLLSSKVISSQADEVTISPFGKSRRAICDLYDFDFVFLQHGITKDNLSGWLNKYTKDIKLFVTASYMEQNSIATPDYGYTEKEVQLTGFPRFDRLESNPQRLITFAPTWRARLAGAVDPTTGRRLASEDFTESDYYKFIQESISHPGLNAALEQYGYRAQLLLHPNHVANAEDFEPTERFSVVLPPYDYREVFSESAILITDYSSVAFDFAYLRKPVIYAQPDADEFFSSHSYTRGYFSYEDDGFGPVHTNAEDTINAVIELMKNGAAMPQTYRERTDAFFAHDDRNNSERTLKAILSLPQHAK